MARELWLLRQRRVSWSALRLACNVLKFESNHWNTVEFTTIHTRWRRLKRRLNQSLKFTMSVRRWSQSSAFRVQVIHSYSSLEVITKARVAPVSSDEEEEEATRKKSKKKSKGKAKPAAKWVGYIVFFPNRPLITSSGVSCQGALSIYYTCFPVICIIIPKYQWSGYDSDANR